MSDYERVAAAIEYVSANADAQPDLDDVAAHSGLSAHHFQRLFKRWAGVTPKRFLQAVTVERARRLLAANATLLDTAGAVGLSGTSRLHDHFVRLEAVTPGEFKARGAGLTIRHGIAPGPFGQTFVAATTRGLVALAFVDGAGPASFVAEVRNDWPRAAFVEDRDAAAELAGRIFDRAQPREPLTVTVVGTNFQIAVWRALLAIPEGRLVAYGDIAEAVGRPRAVRAVGTAVGANPCAFVIPCHRVIRRSGELGGYRWGTVRKRALNIWEAAAADGMLQEC